VRTGLDNRDKYPRVVLQIDSLDKLTSAKWSAPQFDYVVIDEIESLLLHLSAKTLKEPVRIITKLNLMLNGTPNGNKPQLITMDALWSNNSYSYLKVYNISQKLIINEAPPRRQKKFTFTNCEFQDWIEEINSKLADGKNCILQTLSQNHGELVKNEIIRLGTIYIILLYSF